MLQNRGDNDYRTDHHFCSYLHSILARQSLWLRQRICGRTEGSTKALREVNRAGGSMNARDYLNEARATIQDRGLDYGHPSDNMQRTAALWSSYLEMPVTDYQVAMCMALVKIARSMETAKSDTYIDLVAYAAIAGQLHTEENDLYV